jgi:hypothetical protein
VNFLLDKNAVSEWLKPRPNSGLIRWMEEADEDRVLLGGTSLVELYYGVERVAAGTRPRHWAKSRVQSGSFLTAFRPDLLRGCDSAPHPCGFQIASAKEATGCAGVDYATVRPAVAIGARLHEQKVAWTQSKSASHFWRARIGFSSDRDDRLKRSTRRESSGKLLRRDFKNSPIVDYELRLARMRSGRMGSFTGSLC